MTRQPRLPPESFRELLQKNIGQQIYLNADDRHPCRLLEVQTDYIVLTSRGKPTSLIKPIPSRFPVLFLYKM